MSDTTLYKTCLRQIAINLRNGMYKPATTTNRDNIFKRVAPRYVNSIISAALDYQRANEFRVDDLELLLNSGQLQELKIEDIGARTLTSKLHIIIKILNYLQLGCQQLTILHLPILDDYERYYLTGLSRSLKDSIGVILKNAHNLEDLNCRFNFNLNDLRNCRKLRKMSLHFRPQEQWHEFLDRDNEGNFLKHECLEYFTVCPKHVSSENVHYHDIVTILEHCPELTSLGYIESSGLLSHLHGELPLDLKLRHCFWIDMESPNSDFHRVREAVRNYPLIEELDFIGCLSRSVRFLENLRNLVYLNISLDANVSSEGFNSALGVIGPQLKHLSLTAATPMDISLVLKNCHNLESVKIDCSFAEFTIRSVSLPNLQRLTLKDGEKRQVLSLLRDCINLTELFLMGFYSFDDDTLSKFLMSNSILNLKLASFFRLSLKEPGFRNLLQNAPDLEKLEMYSWYLNNEDIRRIIAETNHRVLLCNKYSLKKCEFFEKRRKRYEC